MAAALIVAACGEATAQRISARDSFLVYEIPAEFTALDDDGATSVQYYGVAGSTVGSFGTDPVLSVLSGPGGESESYTSLRSLSVGGRFDPLDTEDPASTESVEIINYVEISEPEVWGVRVQLLVDAGVSDFQALVDRRSDQITVTEMRCTHACFAEQVDLIDRIQRSWSIDP
jgi:hypothetical protein